MSLSVRNLTKRFGGVAAIDGVTLDFPTGSFTAVIGPNGAGKSTFFNLISGAIRPDAGQVLLNGTDITGRSRGAIVRHGIARAFQVASFFPSMTVAENLQAAVAAHRRQWAGLGRRAHSAAIRTRALVIADMLGLTAVANTLSAALSHGDQKLLDIALALALEPSVLLLDEPTAGMGPEERWAMIGRVKRLWEVERLTLVFIEHDMDIVFRVSDTIRVLCYGRVLAEGTPDSIRADPAVIGAYLGTGDPAA